jgi:phosphomannomutase
MQWNGLKFISSTGMFLTKEENEVFWEIADRGNFHFAQWNSLGTVTADTGMLSSHINAILTHPYLQPEKIRERKFKIVLDCVNAAGGAIVPNLLRALGCDIVEMNCDVSGIFSHTPEPLPENLVDLCRRVVSEKADAGIAVDPDVDRLVLITEKGESFIEEYTVAMAVQFVLAAEKKLGHLGHSVVVNLSTTRAVDDIAAGFGAKVVRTPVGEINVASKMKSIGAVIGGEGSGGVILPSVHYGRDAIVGIGLFLQLLMEFGGTASSLKASLPSYAIVKDKIAVGTLAPDDILSRMNDHYSKTYRTNNDDGLKIDFPSSWVHLRKSNTEPIIRIIAEAKTRVESQQLVDRFKKEILA